MGLLGSQDEALDRLSDSLLNNPAKSNIHILHYIHIYYKVLSSKRKGHDVCMYISSRLSYTEAKQQLKALKHEIREDNHGIKENLNGVKKKLRQ